MEKFTKENLSKWMNAYLNFLEDVVISKLPVDYKNLYDTYPDFGKKLSEQSRMHQNYTDHVLKLSLSECKEYNHKHLFVIHNDTPDKEKILNDPTFNVLYIDNEWHYLPEKYDLNTFSLNAIIDEFKGALPELWKTEGLIFDFIKIHPEYKGYWNLKKGSDSYCDPKIPAMNYMLLGYKKGKIIYKHFYDLPCFTRLVEMAKKWKNIKENKTK